MTENKLTIRIDKPTSAVFDFTVEPDNTPLWIDSIVSEKVSERPMKVGTIYKNTDKEGDTNTYEVTKFSEGQMFELKSVPPGYTVRYTYTPISLTETEMEYFEWVDEGDLGNPFTMEPLEKLKEILEK